MFFCEPCREHKQWPESLAKSRGTCEVCKVYAVCNDVPSSVIGNLSKIEAFLEQPQVLGVLIDKQARGDKPS